MILILWFAVERGNYRIDLKYFRIGKYRDWKTCMNLCNIKIVGLNAILFY